MQTDISGWLWGAFALTILIMLALDLFLRGSASRVSVKEAALWSVLWVLVALAFDLGLWAYFHQTQGLVVANDKAGKFLTGYLIEQSLSMDNVFVWLTLFTFFRIPPDAQRRVLIYGVLGAIVLRTLVILLGSWLVREFGWILYIFGAFLIFTGAHMAWVAGDEPDLDDNRLLRWLRGHLRVTKTLHGHRFTLMEQGKLWVTPLLVVLIMIELSDILFAVDSIPAIFAITRDPFIALTSNLFAVMGLRSMYFLFAGLAERFTLLDYGLALVLIFIGTKLLIEPWMEIPILWSLLVVAAVIGSTMIISWVWADRTDG